MAFLAPDGPRQPIFRAPAIVLLLIALFVLVHVSLSLMPAAMADALVNSLAFVPARYSAASLSQSGTSLVALALPFLGYMTLHADYGHLGINCLGLLAFGPIVARRFGWSLFLLFFIICGVAGAAAYLAFNWGSPDAAVGASGAISGLMAPAIRLLPTVRPSWANEGDAVDVPMLPLWSRQMILFSLIWALFNIVTALTGLGVPLGEGAIAWQAHLGGYAAGLVLSGLFDRLRPRPVPGRT